MLHTVGGGCGTIKEYVGGLCGLDVACKINMKHRTRLRKRYCVVVWGGWKVTVADIIHDRMSHLRHRGLDGG